MKFSFQFSNLLGAVYRKGNLLFTPDGNSVISPVGNRICIYDLKNNKSSTLPVESRFNYEYITLSPSGNVLIAVNEEGEAHLITMVTKRKIFTYRFNEKVRCIKFSPDGKYFAVCKLKKVFIYKAPEQCSTQYSGQFKLEKVFSDFLDDTTSIDWTDDSRILAVGAKDNVTKIIGIPFMEKFSICALLGHTDSIVGTFFESDSLHVNTISRNGVLCMWECNLELSDLKSCVAKYVKRKEKQEEKDHDDDDDDEIDLTRGEEREEVIAKRKEVRVNDDSSIKMKYTLVEPKRYLNDYNKNEKRCHLTCCEYHKKTRVLITGFTNGAFFIFELPDVTLLRSLSMADTSISSIVASPQGDWIALGCENQGQLLVWEWQSESYILKQQAHSSLMSCLDYSADGLYIVTGGEDGKIKVWNTQTGYCFITFNEHSSSVTAVKFASNRKFLISASTDGTVRAFDMARYRNFRTFVSPRPVQFSCLAIDATNEFVAAGAQDVFEIYLWSMKIGHLLECLAGHVGPVVSISFTPIASSSAFVSTSWDKTVRFWNTIESAKDHDTVQLLGEGLCAVYRPDGKEVAVASLDGQISFFDPVRGEQTRSIEGRNDLGSGRSETDLITAKKSAQAKAFTTLCYSADGNYIIAAGQSKNVCIYYIAESILIKKFEITQNRSLDGLNDYVNHRKMTEFGNIDLVEKREPSEGGNVKIRLPGVVKGDMAARSFKPEVRVFDIAFSPTGLAWSAVSTEGVLIYSLDSNVVFDPFQMEIDVNPTSIKETLMNNDHSKALIMSLKLNETKIVKEVLESVPVREIELCVSSLPKVFLDRLLKFVAVFVENSPLIEYYLIWIEHLLNSSGSVSTCHSSILLTLHRNLSKKYNDLVKVCDFNKYTMKFIEKMSARKAMSRIKAESEAMEVDDAESYQDDEIKEES